LSLEKHNQYLRKKPKRNPKGGQKESKVRKKNQQKTQVQRKPVNSLRKNQTKTEIQKEKPNSNPEENYVTLKPGTNY